MTPLLLWLILWVWGPLLPPTLAGAGLTQRSLLGGHVLFLAEVSVGASASAQEKGYWFKFQPSVFPRYQPSHPD